MFFKIIKVKCQFGAFRNYNLHNMMQIKFFSDKKPENFENFFYNNRRNNQNSENSESESSENFNKDYIRTGQHINSAPFAKLKSKRINLVKVYHNDLLYFKLDRNFDMNELRKKYLALAKLYHPDTGFQEGGKEELKFNKLQHTYERLKTFYELRCELDKIEFDLSNGAGKLSTDSFDQIEKMEDSLQEEYSRSTEAADINDITKMDVESMSKEQFIKHLLIEEEFGDIKEPKFALHFLIGIWFVIGILVFYIDLSKYYSKLKIKREGIDYK